MVVKTLFGATSLPLVVDDCVFQADRVMILQGESRRVEWLECSRGECLYESQHSTWVQRLGVGLEGGCQLCLELERIIAWSGQGGRPSQPWRKLLDIAELLGREYALPVRRLPDWGECRPGAPAGA
ncbi:hypothetical protein JST97_32785 [bacterium]|nr:hypothetical protein [bacterium]